MKTESKIEVPEGVPAELIPNRAPEELLQRISGEIFGSVAKAFAKTRKKEEIPDETMEQIPERKSWATLEGAAGGISERSEAI